MQVVSADQYRRDSFKRVVLSESGQPELKEEWDYEPEVPEVFFEDDGKAGEMVGVSPAQFTEFAIKVPDKVSQRESLSLSMAVSI